MSSYTIHYQAGAKELMLQLFGRELTDEELGSAVGAPEGAILDVSNRRKGQELFVEVHHLRIAKQERSFRRDADGDLYVYNLRFEKRERRDRGLGLECLLRQIGAAYKLGLDRIELHGSGSLFDSDDGYWRWPLYGFDAPLMTSELSELANQSQFAGVTSLNELIERGGSDWLRVRGSGRSMYFLLAPNSSMMRVLRAYLDARPLVKKQLAALIKELP